MKHVNVNKKMKVFSGLNIRALRMRGKFAANITS